MGDTCVAGKAREREEEDSYADIHIKRVKADSSIKVSPPNVRVTQPVRERSDLSAAVTIFGSDDTDSDKDKADAPPMLTSRRMASTSESQERTISRSGSFENLQIELPTGLSPLGLERRASAAGFHLSCPFQDLQQLDSAASDDGEGERIASPTRMTTITTVSEELKVMEEMKKVQESAKRAVRAHADAKYCRRLSNPPESHS